MLLTRTICTATKGSHCCTYEDCRMATFRLVRVRPEARHC